MLASASMREGDLTASLNQTDSKLLSKVMEDVCAGGDELRVDSVKITGGKLIFEGRRMGMWGGCGPCCMAPYQGTWV